MPGAQTVHWTTQDVADSFALWWRDAGLHSLTSDQAHGWLDADEERPVTHPAPDRLPERQLAPPSSKTPGPKTPGSAPRRPMPNDLAAFRAWLGEDPAQPEAAWRGPACLPAAQSGARLLVLTEMPDADMDDSASPFAPPVRRFLAAMLGAIGLGLDLVAFAPLAMRRPPGGLLDDATHAALTLRIRHYLGLARPRAVLILGDRTSRALVSAPADVQSGILPRIDVPGADPVVAALPSPEHLMRRPSAKAASWQTLRLLAGAMSA